MKLTGNRKKRFVPDLKLLIPVLIISFLGIVTLLSTTILPSGGYGDLDIVWKQIIFLIVGIILYFGISFIDLSYLKSWQVLLLIYVPTLLLLIATLVFGPRINNVKRWLVIGGIQIQPSEIAKVVVIIYTAALLSLKDRINQWILFGISFLLTSVLFLLIYLEPDGSMSLLTMAMWFFVSFFGLSNLFRNTALLGILGFNSLAFLLSSITGNWFWMLLLLAGITITVFGFYYKDSWKKFVIITFLISLILGGISIPIWEYGIRGYQRDRIEAYFNPDETQEDIGFNVNQARISIGSGQIFGKGFGNGTQSKRDFLPEHQTDFIFASFAEEFGLVGAILLLACYGVIITNCILLAMNTIDNPMYSLIALGIGLKILLELFINIGTNTGVVPATGIPLPLMTAGGSVTIMTLVSLGLVQNISSRYNLTEKNVGKNILEDF